MVLLAGDRLQVVDRWPGEEVRVRAGCRPGVLQHHWGAWQAFQGRWGRAYPINKLCWRSPPREKRKERRKEQGVCVCVCVCVYRGVIFEWYYSREPNNTLLVSTKQSSHVSLWPASERRGEGWVPPTCKYLEKGALMGQEPLKGRRIHLLKPTHPFSKFCSELEVPTLSSSPAEEMEKDQSPLWRQRAYWVVGLSLLSPKNDPQIGKKRFRPCRTSGMEGTEVYEVCKDSPISVLPPQKLTQRWGLQCKEFIKKRA